MFHDRKRNRLAGYDYASAGWYFVTVCAGGRLEFFGKIKNNVMCVNKRGSLVYQQWHWLAEQYPYVALDEFIVMPNHVHGVIGITGDENDDGFMDVGTGRDLSLRLPSPRDLSLQSRHDDLSLRLPSPRDLSLHSQRDLSLHDDTPVKIKPLSELIGAFKTTSSKLIHRAGVVDFCWQRSFYDRIIRDPYELARIRQYIINNPKNWQRDRNNAAGLLM